MEKFSTIIYYEQRGCGRSDLPLSEDDYSIELLISDLKELCNVLNLDLIIPLGFSFGGELALEFTISYPDLVDKTIAQAPSMFSDSTRMSKTQIDGFLIASNENEEEEINEILHSEISVEEKCSKIWDIVSVETVDKFLFRNQKFAKLNRKMWSECGLVNTGNMMNALLKSNNKTSLMERIRQIKSPTLILTGKYDYNVGVEMNSEIVKNISKSKHVIFDESAHFPDIEESMKYAEQVKIFIK